MYEFTVLVQAINVPLVARAVNVISCGLMVGAAMFYPISAAESHRYSEIVLPTFAISLIVWLALNLEAFMGVGKYTVPLGLVILMLAVIQVGPTNEAFVAWLPLYVTTVGIITTSAAHFLKQPVQNTDLSPINVGNNASSPHRTATQQPERQQISVMARWMREPAQPLAARIMSQDAHHIPRSEISASTMSLSSTGQVRSSWGSLISRFWNNPPALPHNRIPYDGPALDNRYSQGFERYRNGSPPVETDVGSSDSLVPHDEF